MPHVSVYQVYKQLFKSYGAQNWWPGDTPFEVMVGAVLTQNTSWTNVEKAIAVLKSQSLLSPDDILSLPHAALAKLLTPVGYFNVKARRLRNFCQWYKAEGEYKNLEKRETHILRGDLLRINGIGPETADDILLYAFHRPVFVIDAYTRRLFKRLGLIEEEPAYDEVRLWFEKKLGRQDNKTEVFNEYHALIVLHAKYHCKRKPVCIECCLRKNCLTGAGN